ncbi:MAG: pantetheine-phosphate adenylyltransferase [Candidatus Promineifilaceae bacterium]
MSVRGLYPGTFDPIHNGHLDIIERATRIFDEVVVAVYDHSRANLKKVLFSIDERIQLAEENLAHLPNVSVTRYNGMTADFANEVGAKAIVRGLRVFSDFEFEFRMALVTQRLAPEIEYVTLMTREENMFLSGTTLREIASLDGDFSSMVPEGVRQALTAKYRQKNA